MTRWILCVLMMTGCDYVFRIDRVSLPDGALDSNEVTLDDGGSDGDLDASLTDALSIDTPPDAWTCTAHSQCSAMTSGTCCVNPGPAGYCTPGIVIGGSCDPQ
jgi:hypothetical protein